MKQILWAIPLIFALVSCSSNPKDSCKIPTQLVQDDLAALRADGTFSAAPFDKANHSRFSQMFGGPSHKDVANYIDQRAKYFIGPNDRVSFPDPVHKEYLVSTKPKKKPRSTKPKLIIQKQCDSREEGDFTMATNVGAFLWYQALVDQVPITFRTPDWSAPVNSSSVGIIYLSGAYSTDVPQLFRNETLAHEARHSDCTGGLDSRDLELARKSTSYEEFSKGVKSKTCTHPHVMCPVGHDYEGITACDDSAWGAYTTSVVYATAVLSSVGPGSSDYQFLKAVLIDMKDRLNFDYEDMMSGKFGDPDMSSSGVF